MLLHWKSTTKSNLKNLNGSIKGKMDPGDVNNLKLPIWMERYIPLQDGGKCSCSTAILIIFKIAI